MYVDIRDNLRGITTSAYIRPEELQHRRRVWQCAGHFVRMIRAAHWADASEWEDMWHDFYRGRRGTPGPADGFVETVYAPLLLPLAPPNCRVLVRG